MAKPRTDLVEKLLSDHPTLSRWGELVEDVLRQIRGERQGRQPPAVFADDLINCMDIVLDWLPHLARTDDRLRDDGRPTRTVDLFRQSERFAIMYGVGLDVGARSIYFSAELVTPTHLSRVPDEFWEQMGSLSRHCDEVVYESCIDADRFADPQAIRRVQRSKSAVFRLLSDHALRMASNAESTPGTVVVRWGWGTEVFPLISGAAECFARLSRMNWLLHRIDYLDAHGRTRRSTETKQSKPLN